MTGCIKIYNHRWCYNMIDADDDVARYVKTSHYHLNPSLGYVWARQCWDRGGWYNPPNKSYMQLSAEAVLCTSFRPWWYKLIMGETNFGASAWRRHGGTIVLAAKQRNPILGVKNKFLWKITTAIEFSAQKLTYMPIFMNFGQLSFFSYTWRHTGKVAGGTRRRSRTAPVTC